MAGTRTTQKDDSISESIDYGCSQPYPLEYAGLDPLHCSFMKLFIRDVLSLQQWEFPEEDSTAFLFHDHTVVKVDIVGILVSYQLKEMMHSYVVDDGTGVIMCNLWKSSRKDSIPVLGNTLPMSLLAKLKEISLLNDTYWDKGFEHGDLVQIRGSLTLHNGEIQINIFDIFKLEDPNLELERILELSTLYSKFYSSPFALPKKMTKSSLNSEYALNSESEALKDAVIHHVKDNFIALEDFSVADTFSWPLVMSFISFFNKSQKEDTKDILSSMMETSLKSFSETQGMICERINGELKQYEVIKEGCLLNETILNEMQMLASANKHTDHTGCHLTQILKSLKKNSFYVHINIKVLQRAMQCLECTSDVISTEKDRYMLLG